MKIVELNGWKRVIINIDCLWFIIKWMERGFDGKFFILIYWIVWFKENFIFK